MRKARVVWQGGSAKKGGSDVALVHGATRPYFALPLARWPARNHASGQPVLTAGWGAFLDNENVTGWASGGHLVQALPQESDPAGFRWKKLRHNAPLVPGDSGGPLMNERGEILGLNSTVGCRYVIEIFGKTYLLGLYSSAVSPDPSWIQSLIEKDRAQRRSRKPHPRRQAAS